MPHPTENCLWLEQTAAECVGPVEGQNSQFALHHYGCHRLSDRKLAALTTLHNYFIWRTDGTTAAERFLERLPNPLFPYLLQNLPPPSSLARRRPRPQKASMLLPATA